MKIISSILKYTDIFSKSFGFNIEGGKYNSSLGGFISLILYGLQIFLPYDFSKNMFNRTNPNVILQDDYYTSYPIVNHTNYRLQIPVIIYDVNTLDLIYNKSLYDVRYAHYKTYYNGSISNYVDFSMEVCTNDTFYKNTDEVTKLFFLENNAVCIGKEFIMGGYYTDDYMYNPLIYVKKCDNQTENEFSIKCAKSEEIPKISFMTFNPVYAFRPNNYTHYTDLYFVDNSVFVDEGSTRLATTTYTLDKIENDIGLFWEEKTNMEFSRFNSVTLSPNKVFLKNNYSFAKIFVYDKFYKRYQRNYLKVQDVLANVGGLMNLITTVVQFIFSFYTNIGYNLYFSHSLLNLAVEKKNIEHVLDQNEKNIQKADKSEFIELRDLNKDNITDQLPDLKDRKYDIQKDSPQEQITRSISSNRFFLKNIKKKKYAYLHEGKYNPNLKEMIDYQKKERISYKIGKCERLKLHLTCKSCYISNNPNDLNSEINIKMELAELADCYLDKTFDSINMLKTMQMMKTLTKLFLNKEQYLMLKNRKRKLITFQEALSEDKVKDLLKEYFNKKDEGNLSIIDKYLYELVHEDLRNN